jgi:hypothetical protein
LNRNFADSGIPLRVRLIGTWYYRSVAARRWIELEPLSLRVAGGSGWRDPAGTGVARI